MTLDPKILRSEQYPEVGRLIRSGADELVRRWEGRAIQELPNGHRTHAHDLRDHLPVFLARLADGLANVTPPDDRPHCGPAAEHGEQRWQTGWALGEVIRDYQILRVVLLDYLEEQLGRPLLLREVQALGLALDEAIGASVSTYVRHRDEAQAQADRRKNEFLAVLGHELRNPLAPILTSVQVLRLLGTGDPRVVEARDIIERQTRQLTRLVDDLLDTTRIAQGKVELRRTTFDLAAAVSLAVQQTAPLFTAQGNHLSVELPEGPLAVHGDQARIVQVLVNLLNNAAKYTDRGGQVWLRAAREGDEVVVRVRDTGIGIEANMLERVFNLFTQVEEATRRAQGGLGIGLTLVRQLVELHGGRVTAHSEGPGRGSEFVVRLPAGVAPPAAAPRAAAQGQSGVAARHILVVEDKADSRETLATLLRLLGHQVEEAATGPEGVRRALDTRPQVALIDLGLPQLDGYEVARQVRAALGASVLLVALTGHASEEHRNRTAEAGFDAHLAKPVELEQLEAVLRQVP
jgi:signal transduction histidine kinase